MQDTSAMAHASSFASVIRLAYALLAVISTFLTTGLSVAIDFTKRVLDTLNHLRTNPPGSLAAVQRALDQVNDDKNIIKQDLDLALARLERLEALEPNVANNALLTRIERLEALGMNFAARMNLDAIAERFEHMASRLDQQPSETIVEAAEVPEALVVEPEPLTAAAAIKVLSEATGSSTAPAVEWAAKCLVREAGGEDPKGPLTARRMDRVLDLGAVKAVLHALDVMVRSGTRESVHQCLRLVLCIIEHNDPEDKSKRDSYGIANEARAGSRTQRPLMDGFLPSLVYDAMRAYPELVPEGVRIFDVLIAAFDEPCYYPIRMPHRRRWVKSLWKSGFPGICLGLLQLVLEDELAVGCVCNMFWRALDVPSEEYSGDDYVPTPVRRFIKRVDVSPIFNVLCRYRDNEAIFKTATKLLWCTSDDAFLSAISGCKDPVLAVDIVRRMFAVAFSDTSYYQVVRDAFEQARRLHEADATKTRPWEPPYYPSLPLTEQRMAQFDDYLPPIILYKRRLVLPGLLETLPLYAADDAAIDGIASVIHGDLPSPPWTRGVPETSDTEWDIPTGTVLDLLGNARVVKHANAVRLLLEILAKCKAGDAELAKRVQKTVRNVVHDFKEDARIPNLVSKVLRLAQSSPSSARNQDSHTYTYRIDQGRIPQTDDYEEE